MKFSSPRPPCIVCGAPSSRVRGHRNHLVEVHDQYRKEYRRWANLLRSRCPALPGLQAVAEFYDSDKPTTAPRVEWGCKVLTSGEVIHRRIEKETA